MKILYTFTQKVKGPSVNGEDGPEKEYTIKLKELSRRDKADLSVIYNAEYGKALSKGLAPHSALRKSAVESGGLLARQDLERAEEVYRAVITKSNEKQLMISEGKADGLEALDNEIEDLWAEYQEYEKPATILYSRSAEYEAEKNSVVWAVLNFTFVEKNGKEELLFPGITDGSKLDYYYECLEAEKELETIVFEKAYTCFLQAIKTPDSGKEIYDILTQ